jgi:cell division protein FtsQ
VAKHDSQSSRQTAIVQDEAMERFYRPVAPPESRARLPKQIDLRQNQPRPFPAGVKDDGDEDVEDAFFRARRRVPIRRGILPKSKVARIGLAAAVALGLAALVALGIAVREFLKHDPRFRIDSSSSIQIMGNSQVTRPELLSVFGSDIGRNVFFIPLEERRAELERLPWVAHATVMRLLPNQLRVAIVERIPVAFVRNGNTIGLVDAHGVMLDMPPGTMAVKHYSFPVVTGISGADPLSERAARMRFYQRFISDLDSGGGNVSRQLSEVDISDSEDIRALLPTQSSDSLSSEILVHFGDSDFLTRYERYKQHLAEWRRQYPHLASVDMRYDNQVVLAMAKGVTVEAGQDGNYTPAARSKTEAPSNSPRQLVKPVRTAQAPAKSSTQKRTQTHNEHRKPA